MKGLALEQVGDDPQPENFGTLGTFWAKKMAKMPKKKEERQRKKKLTFWGRSWFPHRSVRTSSVVKGGPSQLTPSKGTA